MANRIGILLLALVCVNFVAAYPSRAYYYPVPDSEELQDDEGYYQLIPVRRDARSVPTEDNDIVIPRRQIMMAMAPPPPRVKQERERELREPQRPRFEERDYLYAAPTNYEPVPAETGNSHGHYDYVDYGAYTGGHGAFGWYSDHPVYVQSSGHYE